MPPPGRKPDPAPLRLLKNDKAHQHRHVGKEEPEPSSDLPVPPVNLSVRAKEIFIEFVAWVSEMYPPSKTDTAIIVQYANNQEQLESYELTLRLEGSIYKAYVVDQNGDAHLKAVKPHPLANMFEKCKAVQRTILTEFGLSPSSRSRINLKPGKPKKKDNPFDKMSSKGKTG